MSVYSEDTLVQQTTAEYLKQQLGWESVYAYNNEDFGPDSLLGRASDCEVVLKRTLRTKLAELNPGLPDEAYDDAVRPNTATVAPGFMAGELITAPTPVVTQQPIRAATSMGTRSGIGWQACWGTTMRSANTPSFAIWWTSLSPE